jgi:sensor domain CHASE-containing protein
MEKLSLYIYVKEILQEFLQQQSFLQSIWFWLAVTEFVIIIILVFRHRRKNEESTHLSEVSKERLREIRRKTVDMDSLMKSINGSRDLYKELSRSCHPDRFVNTDQHEIAEALFQDVSKYKRDYTRLLALKERASIELNINFKN